MILTLERLRCAVMYEETDNRGEEGALHAIMTTAWYNTSKVARGMRRGLDSVSFWGFQIRILLPSSLESTVVAPDFSIRLSNVGSSLISSLGRSIEPGR